MTNETLEGYKHGRVPRAVRERQLLDLAERRFIDHGYAGFSIEDLCRDANVSRPIVYDHFGSKAGIFLACLRRIRDEFEQTLIDAAASAPDAPSAIKQGADAYFRIIERDPKRWSLVYGGSAVPNGPLAEELYELRAGTVERIAAVAARFAPNAKRDALTAYANFVSGAGEQLGHWWLRNPKISRRRIVTYYLEYAVAAMQPLLER